MRRTLFLLPATLLLLPIILTALHAQTGSIKGRVLDSAGAPLNRATVRIEGTSRGGYTSAEGKFLVGNIPIGTFDVRITFAGKQEYIAKSVRIEQEKTVDIGTITMLDKVTTTRIVIAAYRANLDNPGAVDVKSGEDILRTTRGSQNALATVALGASACGTQGNLAIRGMRASDAILRVDGVEQSDRFSGSTGNNNLTPSVLGLAELQVDASGDDASKNNSFGGGVELTTRNGENELDAPHQSVLGIRHDSLPENPFYNPLYQALSTFSIDVDVASYALVRSYLNAGTMPLPEGVRIEEMINRFHYSYPQPEGDRPFSVTLDAAECPWRRNSQIVRVGIQGRTIAMDQLPPANLVFLIDVSGSMQSVERLPLLKRAFRSMVEHLRPQDRVAIVTYAGASGLALPSTSGEHKEEILAALDRLEAGGSTNGAEGILLAYRTARENATDGSNNRVILATDGDFNVGITDDSDLVRLIEEERRGNIFLTTLGVGTSGYSDKRMETLADRGDGNYAYLDNDKEAERVLVGQIAGTLYTIAKDVKVQVEFDPRRVAAYRLIGYENRTLAAEDFDNDRRDAGELGAGHTVTALYEVVPVGAERSVEELRINDTLEIPRTLLPNEAMVRVRLRYKQPTDSVSQLVEASVPNRATRIEAASPDFRFAAGVAAFGMLLRHSQHRGSADQDMVLRLAGYASGERMSDERAEFIELVKKAGEIGNLSTAR